MARNPIVFDKAKYHFETVGEHKLPEEQAYVHTAFYFRWLLENRLMGEDFIKDSQAELDKFYRGELSALEIYQDYWDGCLFDTMLSEEGTAFSNAYFDFDRGRYLKDYKLLEKGLASTYHVPFTEENYRKLKPLIDAAYQEWKFPRPKKPWWQFW